MKELHTLPERDSLPLAVASAKTYLRDTFGHYRVRTKRRRKNIRVLTGPGVRGAVVGELGEVEAGLNALWNIHARGRQRILFVTQLVLDAERKDIEISGVPVLTRTETGTWEPDDQASRDKIKKAALRARRGLMSFIASLILTGIGSWLLVEAAFTARLSTPHTAADETIASFMVVLAFIIFLFARRSWHTMRRADGLRRRAQEPQGSTPGRWPRIEARHILAPAIMIAAIIIALIIYRT